jgi:general secretion pathway protein D
MAGINYLIDPRVRGVVNVHTQGTVDKEGALDLLFSILKVNGATAVREGEIYHIIPLAEAKMEPLLPEEWKEKKGDPSSSRPVLRAFPLQYTVAAEMAKVIKPFVSAGGDVTEVPGANMVLVMDTAANMEKHARLIELFDREPPGTSRKVYLYRVRHGKVQDVMNILTKLFPEKTAARAGKSTAFKPKVAEPAVKTAATVARQEERSAAGQEGGTKEGGFDIIPDEPTNSIIIRGSASEYAALLNVLKVIDVYPRQVLLEVLIAEVQLDDELRLGIDWRYMSQSGDESHDVSLVTSASGINTGLLYAFEKTNRLMASVRALADDGKVSILSSPSVISTNGKESKIEVAQQIPVTSGQVTNVTGAADVITETVEYRDVGILLSFTPYINDEGLITLEINQEQSEVASATGGALNNPTFLKRSIQTTLLATQDRSIVLGGLVQERRQRSRDGIPFLYKIPFIGWIFGARSASVSRTELLIFITPRVIESVEEGTQLSGEFEDRVEELKRRISESEGLRPSLKEPEKPDSP